MVREYSYFLSNNGLYVSFYKIKKEGRYIYLCDKKGNSLCSYGSRTHKIKFRNATKVSDEFSVIYFTLEKINE